MNTQLGGLGLATTLLASFALSGPTHAQSPFGANTTAPSRIVHYSAADLSTPTGTRQLYWRIRLAAWEVCGQMMPTGIANARCRQTLVDAAVADVNDSALTALNSGKRMAIRTASRLSPTLR